MLGAIGFGIPTIIIAIVFVVHLARSRYSRRHHPNYRVGTRYHRHFYRGLRPVPRFSKVSCDVDVGEGKKKAGKYVRRNSTRRCCDGVLAQTRVRFARFSELRAVRKSGSLRRASVRAICRGSSCRVGVSSRTVILFSVRIEGRTSCTLLP